MFARTLRRGRASQEGTGCIGVKRGLRVSVCIYTRVFNGKDGLLFFSPLFLPSLRVPSPCSFGIETRLAFSSPVSYIIRVLLFSPASFSFGVGAELFSRHAFTLARPDLLLRGVLILISFSAAERATTSGFKCG